VVVRSLDRERGNRRAGRFREPPRAVAEPHDHRAGVVQGHDEVQIAIASRSATNCTCFNY
jgi:hypothetical protein